MNLEHILAHFNHQKVDNHIPSVPSGISDKSTMENVSSIGEVNLTCSGGTVGCYQKHTNTHAGISITVSHSD